MASDAPTSTTTASARQIRTREREVECIGETDANRSHVRSVQEVEYGRRVQDGCGRDRRRGGGRQGKAARREASQTQAEKSNGRARARATSADDRQSSSDPVRVYLRDMGQVSLLTREGEVIIAKRIEAGIHDQELIILGNAFGIANVLEIADRVEADELELAQALDGLDDEGAPPIEDRRKQLALLQSRIKKIETEIARKRSSISNSRTTQATRDRLRAEIEERYADVVVQLREARFAKARIQEIAGCLAELDESFGLLEERARKAVASCDVGPEEFVKLAKFATRRSAKAREALAALGGDAALVAATAEELDEIDKSAPSSRPTVALPTTR